MLFYSYIFVLHFSNYYTKNFLLLVLFFPILIFSQENNKLKEVIEEKNIFVENLKEEIPKIKLAKSLGSEEGSTDAKMKINELVREIDKCIGLLNQ